MPSTYSPDLRIELIANGEQSGTWGTTTNVNLGTLIEDAIAGYVSVSITSANQALTANNGTADQARNMVVNLTTTTAANFNVYVPPVNKFYVIRNSSAYQATIYCSTVIGNTTAAGTGIAIPASKETIVFADGTNVVSAIDYAPSLVLGAALPVASGGTGLTAGTSGGVLYYSAAGTLASSAALAANALVKGGGAGVAPSTITTGTNVLTALGVNVGSAGAFVVNGGVLGTPSSGTLTNCTFPTLNQNTTGTAAGLSATLVATSGGTGQSSYAVGDLLFASTTTALSKLADVATGSALISGGVGVAPSYGKIGLTTHVSGTLPVANGGTGITSLGTDVATALGVNVGTAGAFVVNGGALGTPSSGTVTNLTGTASININGTVGATTANTGAFTSVTSTSASGVLTRAAATQDGVELIGRAGGTTSLKVTLTPTTLTASRTLTLPNNSGTILTSGAAVTVAQGGTGQTSYTNGQLLIGNTTGNTLSKATLTAGAGIVITNGTGTITIAADVFPAATAMLFVQTAAPTGWTKSTTHNNKALRVVSGTVSSGGTVAFTTAFNSQSVTGTVGNTTLTTSQIPSHAHQLSSTAGVTGSYNTFTTTSTLNIIGTGQKTSAARNSGSSLTGDGSSHNHTFTGTAIDLNVQYVDVIIATKD